MLRYYRLILGHPRRLQQDVARSIRNSSTLGSLSNVHSDTTFKPGDRVLLSWVQSKELRKKLSKPLRADGNTIVNNLDVPHNELIGQPSNQYVKKSSKNGTWDVNILAQHPSLDDFTALSPRKVAPIYASYASSIVDLLDIHVHPPSSANDPTSAGPSFEILEAGTGHGSLTIHLSRAIAAANPPPPVLNNAHVLSEQNPEALAEEWSKWRKSRRAVVHTVDIEKENSKHASDTIRSFRNALYWPHIDFYTGNVKEWLQTRSLQSNPVSQLDAVVLDMPDVHQMIESAEHSLKPGGRLLVFTPQITQVAQCVQVVKDKRMALVFDGALELGDGISSGRMWDVRVANIRAERKVADQDSEHDGEGFLSEDEAAMQSPRSMLTSDYIRPMVCRPRVFERTRGGGFVGIWKKKAIREDR